MGQPTWRSDDLAPQSAPQDEKGPLPQPGEGPLTWSGAKRARTADLLHAMQALYQLSYSPDTAHATGTRTGDSIPVPRTLPNIVDTGQRPTPNPQAQRPAITGRR